MYQFKSPIEQTQVNITSTSSSIFKGKSTNIILDSNHSTFTATKDPILYVSISKRPTIFNNHYTICITHPISRGRPSKIILRSIVLLSPLDSIPPFRKIEIGRDPKHPISRDTISSPKMDSIQSRALRLELEGETFFR